MIIILNGSVGVGKTSVAWALSGRFPTSVMLDGDYIGAVHPFELASEARVAYLYETLAHLVAFHKTNGYPDFVLNYVFESPDSLAALVEKLEPLDSAIHTFWLTCTEEEQRARILKRRTDQWEWELKRFLELNAIQEQASKLGFIGNHIDTTAKTAKEVAALIWASLKPEG